MKKDCNIRRKGEVDDKKEEGYNVENWSSSLKRKPPAPKENIKEYSGWITYKAM